MEPVSTGLIGIGDSDGDCMNHHHNPAIAATTCVRIRDE